MPDPARRMCFTTSEQRRGRRRGEVLDLKQRVARGETLETLFATTLQAGGDHATWFLLAVEANEDWRNG